MAKENDSTQKGQEQSSSRRHFLKTAAGVLAAAGTGLSTSPAALGKDNGPKDKGPKDNWITTWSASAHGTYPVGSAILQPVLSFAFPGGTTSANDQTFRLIVRPTVWGDRIRLRFSNFFGSQPLTIDNVFVGLQARSGALEEDTNVPVSFQGGQPSVVIPTGGLLWSDAINVKFAHDPDKLLLYGRKLAVSFHVVGISGLMTWHSKGLQTSYISAPGGGSHGDDESDAFFPYSTTSWYFLDAIDTGGSKGAVTVVAFGDSITDGTGSTLNGDDRWPDDLGLRLREAYGNSVAVANAGIGGNQILNDSLGGPAALSRLNRDVVSLSGVSAVVWLEGINDLNAGASADAVINGIKSGVASLRASLPGVKIIQATITSSLGSPLLNYGTAELNSRRQAVNAFIRTAGIFDAVADFDAATVDPNTGQLRQEFQPNSSTAGIDFLHPNRAGYLAIAQTIDIDVLAPPH